jgi:dienelactone hydrolase
VLLALAIAAPGPPARAADAVERLLWESPTPAILRARLLDFAATAPESAVAGRAAALHYAALSFEREGRADSALLLLERAVAVRGLPPERDALVDALLARGRPEDGLRALEVLGPRLQEALRVGDRETPVIRARQAWALYAAGRGDSALGLMRSQERSLLDPRTPRHRDWRYRLGLLELEHGLPQRCIEVMGPLALASRFQDTDVMGILSDAARAPAERGRLASGLQGELKARDEEEQALLDSLRAARVTFTAADGFPVAGVAVAPSGRRPARAAVVLLDPDETFERYDSLAAGLRRAGYALLLVEPRGSGRSVSASCPLPETWRGREAEMHARVAGDVLAGLRALARHAAVDTTRYLVAGAGTMASSALGAASLDRRARPVVLFSPQPSPVEFGPMAARLKRSRVPVFYVVPVLDQSTLPVAEALYALDPRASRISESEWIGQGAAVFRRDVTALPRLVQWLDESWTPVGASRGSRR